MLHPFQLQASYMLALRPFGCHRGTIATFTRNLSMTAHKYGSGGVKSKIPEGEQDPDTHESRIDPRLEARPLLGSSKELQRLDDWWLKYSQEREQEQKQELQNVTAALMREKKERETIEGRVQIFRAIEEILIQGRLEGVIEWGINEEVSIYQFTHQPEYAKILHEEVQARGLVFEDVDDCVKTFKYTLLPPAGNREETILIKDMDFTPNECAALSTIMKVQAKWPHPLPWREVISGNAYEEPKWQYSLPMREVVSGDTDEENDPER